jgi:hypothetical protein
MGQIVVLIRNVCHVLASSLAEGHHTFELGQCQSYSPRDYKIDNTHPAKQIIGMPSFCDIAV